MLCRTSKVDPSKFGRQDTPGLNLPRIWPQGCTVSQHWRKGGSSVPALQTHRRRDMGLARFKEEGREADTAPVAASHDKLFSWTAHWWPVLPVEALDAKIPTRVDLLGQSFVVWSDSKGQWHCMEDKCPHRLAALSEGRVEGDTIMCSYHGWCFNGAGSCTRIPQLEQNAQAHVQACTNPRSRAVTYPVKVSRGLLWIWPEAGTAAQAVAGATPEQSVKSGLDGQSGWFIRDLPLRYDMLLENLLDPSHAPFSHHGVLGNRYKLTELDTNWNNLKCGPVTPEGFMATAPAAPPVNEFTLTFKAPMSVTGIGGLTFIAVPTKPGWTRLLANTIVELPGVPDAVNSMLKVTARLPWLTHALGRNAVFDGDTALLHDVERYLPVSEGLGKAATRAYYIPAPADAAVVAMRRWIEDYAAPIPTCTSADEPLMPKHMPREQVLDRWSQHVKHCKSCQRAFANIEKGMTASLVAGVLGASGAVGHAAAAVTLVNGTPLLDGTTTAFLAVCVLSLGLYSTLSFLRTKYLYEDYVHATKD